ncbi:hypothetical protein FGIG_00930 [Fasciola gigantica]|uniref:Uncharacterized protein n=1 Tax=Fasciola gigantica TaxID=46835 RepID=A0A504ZBS1_FASGI|nr:hypothetical protein FGIG_00930 [Fasciola gigantica]
MVRQILVWISSGHIFITFCILHSFTVGKIYCRTAILYTPECFGLTSPNFSTYTEYHYSFSEENAAVTVSSSDKGVILETAKINLSATCTLKFQLSVNRAIDVISTFLNHASILDYDENKTQIFLAFWVYVHERDSHEPITLSQVTVTSLSSGLENIQVGGKPWPSGASTFYMTLLSNVSAHDRFRLRFSITMTPVYRCSLIRSAKPKTTSLKETYLHLDYYVFYQQGYIPCQEINSLNGRLYVLCVPRSLLCDAHTNCPAIKGHSLDEPSDRRLCHIPNRLKKRVDMELILGILAVILVLVMIFAMIFTITDYKTWYRRCRGHCASRTSASYDEQSMGTEFSLPIAPPRYDSVENSGARQKTLCKLCSPQTFTHLAYESPPSYTRDREDETGVYPTFVRPLHVRRRPRTSPVGRARQQLFRRRQTTTTEGFTEDTRSLESWTVTFAHTDGMNTSTELPSYRDIASGIRHTRSNPATPNATILP